MIPPRTRRPAALLGLGLLLLAGCDNKSSKSAAPQRSPATAPLDYLAVQGQAKKHSEKVVSLVEVQHAIQQFQAMEERLPKDLNELVSQRYLGAVPKLPPGQRLAYNPQDGSVRVVAAP